MIELTIPMNLPIRKVVADKSGSMQPEWHKIEFAPIRAWLVGREFSAIQRERQSVERLQAELKHEIGKLRGEQTALSKCLNELRRVAGEVDVNLNELLGEVREVTMELAHAIASKLVFEQVDEGRFPIANLVHELIARVPARDPVLIRLHPEDLMQLQGYPAIQQGAGEERVVEYIADGSLDRGDCKAVAGEVKVVYQLRHQVEEIRRQLLSTVSGHDEIGT